MKKVVLYFLLSISLGSYSYEQIDYDSIVLRGNSRIKNATILNVLNLPPKGTVSRSEVETIINKIYLLKYFENIQVFIDNKKLIIDMQERPSIALVNITGNNLIETEQLQGNLTEAGVAAGEVYNKGIVRVIQREILRAYNNEGRYGATVTTSTELIGQGGININIEVEEGDQAYVTRINIIGNKAFTTENLLRLFASEVAGKNTITGSSNRYSKRKLEGDLEALRSWYLDHGYLQFRILSNEVSISPEKDSIEVSISISEGVPYKVQEVDLVIVNYSSDEFTREELKKFILIKKGQVFSQKLLTFGTKIINDRLADLGFAYSEAEYLTELDNEKRLVDIKIIINIGEKILVRRINFANNEAVSDEVLRREMRQYEGAPFSKTLLDRSKERLQRLTYISEVDYVFEKVPGSNSLIDVTFTVAERQSGNFSFGLGYSQVNRLTLQLALSRDNFLNSGDSIGLSISSSSFQSIVRASYRSAYFTDEGVDFTISAQYSNIDGNVTSLEAFTLDSTILDFIWSIPVTEYSSVLTSIGIDRRELSEPTLPRDPSGTTLPASISNDALPLFVRNFSATYIDTYGSVFDYLTSSFRLAYDTRNRGLFPDRGLLLSYDLRLFHAPSGDIPSFYKQSVTIEYYQPIADQVVFSTNFNIGDGGNYANYDSSFDEIPLDQREFLGGINNLRAYEPFGIGPREEVPGLSPRNIGGQFSLYGALELIIDPMQRAIGNATPSENPLRIVAFLDYGYVFPRYSDFSSQQLRYDIGVGIIWVTPVGPLLFSYATPLRDFEEDRPYERSFQFSVGAGF